MGHPLNKIMRKFEAEGSRWPPFVDTGFPTLWVKLMKWLLSESYFSKFENLEIY